jgi:hypothetical protein
VKRLAVLAIVLIPLTWSLLLGGGGATVSVANLSIPDNGPTDGGNEVNNPQMCDPTWGQTGARDLLIARIWLEEKSTVCYEITNQGSIESPSTTTKIEAYFGPCGGSETIYREEPGLAAGSSRTVCLDISSLPGGWCCCETLRVSVQANNGTVGDVESHDPTSNDVLTATFDNPCADGIQDQDEQGTDCGGPCPANCRDCFDDADYGGAQDAGYFCLNSSVVLYTARLALQEYANCLRNPDSRAALLVVDPLMDFSTITVADLEQNTDYIMEAVAYYIDRHTAFMYDNDGDIYDPTTGTTINLNGPMNAADMIRLSGSRSGMLLGNQVVDACPNDYCGDCEDHAILREALMRSLGISWSCAFCADHYDGYFGGGHTFNLVYYRNKWRIMDYGLLGSYFSISRYWNAHNPDNIWNDRLGEHWCPGYLSDPACLFCCNHDPYRWTQNYNGGEVCGSRWLTYYEEFAP